MHISEMYIVLLLLIAFDAYVFISKTIFKLEVLIHFRLFSFSSILLNILERNPHPTELIQDIIYFLLQTLL